MRRGAHLAVRCVAPRVAAITALAALAACLAGCASMRGLQPNEAYIEQHAIFVGRDGHALEPAVGKGAEAFRSDSAYRAYVAGIIDAIRADSVRRGGKHRILVRIHGGLNTLNSSLEASLAMSDSIKADTIAGYYPIFINWQSGLLSSLSEHLFNTRRGQYYPALSAAGLPLTPFYLASDLGQGLARFPLTGVRQLHNYLTQTFDNNQGPAPDTTISLVAMQADTTKKISPVDITKKRERLSAVTQSASASRTSPIPVSTAGATDIQFSRFPYHRSTLEALGHIGAAALYMIPPNVYIYGYRSGIQGRTATFAFSPTWARVLGWIPLKPLATYVVDALGEPAWDMMHRRALGMFQDPNSFGHQQNAPAGYVPPTGAVTTLLDALDTLIHRDTATHYELTIVGHSMGAIVATEVTRRYDSLPIDNLVFMAAAASLREFEVGVMPYMEHHPKTQFYNLTLHPFNDLRESHDVAIPPYGSLLEWVDAFYSHPESDFDRMIGKYTNVMQASFMFPTEIRGRVHIKAFGYNDGKGCGPGHTLPVQHGDFNALPVPFWRPAFWQPNQAGCEEIKAAAFSAAVP